MSSISDSTNLMRSGSSGHDQESYTQGVRGSRQLPGLDSGIVTMESGETDPSNESGETNPKTESDEENNLATSWARAVGALPKLESLENSDEDDMEGAGPLEGISLEDWDPMMQDYLGDMGGQSDTPRMNATGLSALKEKSIKDTPCKFHDGFSGSCWKGSSCMYSHKPYTGGEFSKSR